MTIPTLSDDDMQQTGGAMQTITAAGMTAWLQSVQGYRVSGAAKKRLFQASREEIIRTSRRSTT